MWVEQDGGAGGAGRSRWSRPEKRGMDGADGGMGGGGGEQRRESGVERRSEWVEEVEEHSRTEWKGIQ